MLLPLCIFASCDESTQRMRSTANLLPHCCTRVPCHLIAAAARGPSGVWRLQETPVCRPTGLLHFIAFPFPKPQGDFEELVGYEELCTPGSLPEVGGDLFDEQL